MRALPKICGFPTSEEVMRALKMVCPPLSLSLFDDHMYDENVNEKKTVRRIRRAGERVKLRQSHDGSSIKVW